MDSEGLMPEAVEALCRQRRVCAFYCVPGFHNPTTRCLPEDRHHALAELASEYHFVIVEDDVNRLVQKAPPPPGKRSILGMSAALSEAEVHWRSFLQSLRERGMHGLHTITSDDHSGR